MKRLLGSLASLTLLALLIVPALEAAEWTIDSAHSAAQFSVKHMMVSTVRGDFGNISGTVNYDPAEPEKASVVAEVDVASVNTRNERRDEHLRGEDFFDVARFPKMTFKSTGVEKTADGLKLTGNLTIHGVTKEVTFDVEGPAEPVVGQGGAVTGASATTTINRQDFGLNWNRALEAGGLTVGNEVQITIDLELHGTES